MPGVLGDFAELQNAVDGYTPTSDHCPEAKSEIRDKRLGHGVWDLVFKEIG